MVFSSLPSEVQEKKDDEIEKNTEDDFEASEVPIEEIGSDLEEDNASGNDEGENTEEKKTEDQVIPFLMTPKEMNPMFPLRIARRNSVRRNRWMKER